MAEPLSVVVIACNAEDKLEACLTSVAFAAELLVVDSGSSDGTLAIARRCGAKVINQEWLGFGKQKQFAVERAAHRWVLALDADECVSVELRASIEAELKAPRYQVYQMPRRNRFMGRWLKHGEGYPDWSTRLFNREHARWSDDPVHEKLVSDMPVGRLHGDLLHESYSNLDDYLAKQSRYTTLQAQVLFAKGDSISPARLVLSPLFRFIKFYFFRLGFLDGAPGLIHIVIGCGNSFMKQAKLKELRRHHGVPRP